MIELDGEDHFWEPGMERDKVKKDYLDSIGVRVIRFENKWVFKDIDWVLEQIKEKFNHPRPNGCSSGRA